MERRFGGPRRDFGGRSSGPRRFGGGGNRFNRGPREMHKAVCAECGKECEVPFKPTEGRPVYCRECFQKQRGGSTFEEKKKPRKSEEEESEESEESEEESEESE